MIPTACWQMTHAVRMRTFALGALMPTGSASHTHSKRGVSTSNRALAIDLLERLGLVGLNLSSQHLTAQVTVFRRYPDVGRLRPGPTDLDLAWVQVIRARRTED
jgi:hypothetical protein